MRVITKGATDQSVTLYIVDNTTGLPVTSLAYNSSGIDLWYRREGAAVTSITEATQTASGAHSDGGFVHLANGVYRLDLPDAAVASGVDSVTVGGTLTGYTVYPVTIQLVAVNPQSATAFITGVNSLAPPTNWNLHSIDGNGRVDVIKIAGTTQTARDIGASVLLSPGTGTGQISLASGAVTVGTNNDKTGYSLSQAFPSNFAALGINASGHLSRVTLADTVTTLTGHTPQTGDSYARLGAPATTTIAADIGAVNSTLGTVATSAAAAASSAATAETIVGSGTHGNAALKTLIDAKPTAAQLLATAVSTSNTANTVGDCLNAARAQGFGKWSLNASTKELKLYAPDGTTVVATFDVGPDLTAPLTRTPQ